MLHRLRTMLSSLFLKIHAIYFAYSFHHDGHNRIRILCSRSRILLLDHAFNCRIRDHPWSWPCHHVLREASHHGGLYLLRVSHDHPDRLLLRKSIHSRHAHHRTYYSYPRFSSLSALWLARCSWMSLEWDPIHFCCAIASNGISCVEPHAPAQIGLRLPSINEPHLYQFSD